MGFREKHELTLAAYVAEAGVFCEYPRRYRVSRLFLVKNRVVRGLLLP